MTSTFSKAVSKSLRMRVRTFLRSKIVGVVVSAGKRVGAQDDAALDLAAEALFPRADIKVHKIVGLFCAAAVTDAVESREVG